MSDISVQQAPKRTGLEAGLWAWWTIATAVGWLIGRVAEEVLSWGLDRILVPAPAWPQAAVLAFSLMLRAITWSASGAIIGAAQFLVLRRRIRHAGRWIWITVLAWGAGSVVGELMLLGIGWLTNEVFYDAFPALLEGSLAYFSLFLVGLLYWTGHGLGIGVTVGFSQWLLLRRQCRRAGWWVPANVVGWAPSMLAAWLGGSFARMSAVAVLPRRGPTLCAWTCGVLGGAMAGAVTGIVLAWLLAQD